MFSQFVWFVWIIVIGLRVIPPQPIPDDAHAWVQISFTIILYFFTIITALGIGKKLTTKLTELTFLEQILIALLIGFGVISIGVFILGLVGQLTVISIYIWLALCRFAASFQWKDIFATLAKEGRFHLWNFYANQTGLERIFLLILFLSLFALIPLVLTPARDYDALMYHLQIPRLVLENGAYYFDPEFYRLSCPALTEMLFLVGIAFRVDIFSQWISLTYALLFFSAFMLMENDSSTHPLESWRFAYWRGTRRFQRMQPLRVTIFHGHVTTSGAYSPSQFGLRQTTSWCVSVASRKQAAKTKKGNSLGRTTQKNNRETNPTT